MDNSGIMLPLGLVLRDRYRVEEYLASGGFGNTYRVHDVHLDEDFALKEFFCRTINSRNRSTQYVTVSNPGNMADFQSLHKKFRKEALRIRSLSGDHIVKVYDLFEEFGTSYYVMDFIDGESLQTLVKQRGPLPEAEVRGYLDQMLNGLDEIHRENIWHLDIKPGNMMLDKRGRLRLIDFGASKLMDMSSGAMTSSMAMAYTPGYAPIEQTEQKIEAIGAHTDLYAIGATLYNLLTGERPPSVVELLTAGAATFHFPSTVSQRLRDLIVWLMQVRGENRPQNVAQVRHFLATPDFETKDVSHPAAVKTESEHPHQSAKYRNAIIKCEECGHEIPYGSSVCPNCGCPTEYVVKMAVKPKRSKTLFWVLAVILLCLFAGGVYYALPSNDKSVGNNKEDAIISKTEEDIVEFTPQFIQSINRYQSIGIFNDGMAAVKNNNSMWGYINTKGEEVIPAKINAMFVGRFSEGLAFVCPDAMGNAYVIDKKGQMVFEIKDFYLDACGEGMCSEDMPYFIDGKLYVISSNSNGDMEYIIYDHQGSKLGSTGTQEGDEFYKNQGIGEYAIVCNKGNGLDDYDENGFDLVYGLKDMSGKQIITTEYDAINRKKDGTTKFGNGVVLVTLTEFDENQDGENGRVVFYYGYADLKGNDTFTDDMKMKCKQSKIEAKQIFGNQY